MVIPEKKDCEPYLALLKEVKDILAIFPFHSNEAHWAASKARQAISAIQERTFERMYYQAREDLSEAAKTIADLYRELKEKANEKNNDKGMSN